MTIAHLPGRPYREDGGDRVLMNELGDGLVETLGYRVLAGRSFDARDFQPDSKAVLVDERFVKKFYPDGAAARDSASAPSRDDTDTQRDRRRNQQQPLPEPARRRPGPDHVPAAEPGRAPGAKRAPGRSAPRSTRRSWPRRCTRPRRAPTPTCP